MTSSAAILLCAGKGTRMGNATINKVAFDCAGVPVVRRIVRNMREGGIGRFVVVVGHRAESVMDALKGEDDVLYAYQAEQRGTGHAALCGLELLRQVGFDGHVVVSMGDKIVSPHAVATLLERQRKCGVDAVLCTQPRPAGPTSRGRVAIRGGRVFGIVEAADVRRALASGSAISLGGEQFSPEELDAAERVNAALYSFDSAALSQALADIGSDNAQGELYLTDVIERFAAQGSLDSYEISDDADLATFSTRPELRALSRRFLRGVSSFSAATPLERRLFAVAAERFGNRPCVVASAPGRINIMGRHIEHRGGSVNVIATGTRTTFVVSPRDDDVVAVENIDPAFKPASFRISDFVSPPGEPSPGVASSGAWLDFLSSPKAVGDLESSRGSWANYVKGAVLRFQLSTDMPLCGMDIVAAGDIPVAAGLSSSSAVVVAAAEALVALNALNVTTADFVNLCGEGEWYVGSRGGAGDHAAMKCSKRGRVTHLKFKPFEIGESAVFPPGCSLVVVHSGREARKAEGARDVFNARIASYERAFVDIRRAYPAMPVECFRDLAFLGDDDVKRALSAVDPRDLGVARYGIDECRRAERCIELLQRGDAAALGAMMKASHDGDRVGAGGYECSTPEIDALCDFLNASKGVYGSQLVGAGLGGCVIALVDSGEAAALVATLEAKGLRAFVSEPCDGSAVVF